MYSACKERGLISAVRSRASGSVSVSVKYTQHQRVSVKYLSVRWSVSNTSASEGQWQIHSPSEGQCQIHSQSIVNEKQESCSINSDQVKNTEQ